MSRTGLVTVFLQSSTYSVAVEREKNYPKTFAYEEWHFFHWALPFAVCQLFYLNLQVLSFFNCMNLSSCLLEVAKEVILSWYLLYLGFCIVFRFLNAYFGPEVEILFRSIRLQC